MIGPMYSVGSTKFTRTIGWRNSSISPRSGTFCGLWTSSVSPLLVVNLVRDVRRGLHQIDIGILLEPLLDDFHVQQAQEAAAEAEAERVARFGLEFEAGIVDRELVERFAQLLEVLAVRRIEAAEDHPLRLFVAGQRVGAGSPSATVTVSPM